MTFQGMGAALLNRHSENHNPRPSGVATGINSGRNDPAEGNWAISNNLVRESLEIGIEPHPRDGVYRNVKVRKLSGKALLDGGVGLKHGGVEKLGAAAIPRYAKGQRWAPKSPTVTIASRTHGMHAL